ncbi:hypothetical protein BV22DRAFT_1134410 [Leucogyrophana mollusca]|uniref:Uncharacterized protein n=1 Tax=Leucogyrophana mollusca TaxID=85980 RepID=A0ACB8AZW0_9AGAM|nr:hypothetical protein BV22DRAFT_1134410 [Leucogyrophana mollusca]
MVLNLKQYSRKPPINKGLSVLAEEEYSDMAFAAKCAEGLLARMGMTMEGTEENYILFSEAGVLTSGKSKISISYDSRLSALEIWAYTSCIHNMPGTWAAATIQASDLKAIPRKLNYWYSTTTFSEFLELWKLTMKQPDIAISPEGDYWPSLMVEVGWNQKYKDLLESAKI